VVATPSPSDATRPARPSPSGGSGKVWLIGAGPGDPELLTLKAVRALGEADVVLLDALADRAVLTHVKPGARIIEAGKRGGCKSTPQAFIERLMIRYAKAGHKVARVKGGDPFVFGRGGEEMLALRAAGIDHEVVSGVTAGIGVPAALGIPVTHRAFAQGVSFVTGHTRDGNAPNWQALVDGGTTLVIFMGMGNLDAITRQLREVGMAGDMPAAAIQSGTLATQRQVITTLDALTRDVAAAQLTSPAIVVVGDVVRLAHRAAVTSETALTEPARRAA
jgi:uroporphyrin-III C-methyltransferase